jgi:hypothetical protein
MPGHLLILKHLSTKLIIWMLMIKLISRIWKFRKEKNLLEKKARWMIQKV